MCDPTLITILKMQPHYTQSSRENATPSSGTSPLASYKEVPPRGEIIVQVITRSHVLISRAELRVSTVYSTFDMDK